MNKGKVFFNPIDGSAPLSISWFKGPKGDAVEARNGIGVGFFSSRGELLGVIFDDVVEKNDYQTLEFDSCRVEVIVKRGKICYSVLPMAPKRAQQRLIGKKSAA